jgi:hypothetical protein
MSARDLDDLRTDRQERIEVAPRIGNYHPKVAATSLRELGLI